MTSTDPGADLELRPATPQDADVLAELFLAAREAARPAMPPLAHPPHEVRRWFGELLDPGSGQAHRSGERETWVAEQEGSVLGYLVLARAWLDALYVRPDRTGEGVGALLLDLAKGLRPDGFGLWVFETNTPAQRFYRRHGLFPVRRTDGSDNEERAPDLEMLWPGRDPLGAVRRRIDDVDDRLGALLNERALLTAAAQRLKPVAGHAGRDTDREAQIVARVARQAPDLGEEAVAAIMQSVIGASLDAVPPDAP